MINEKALLIVDLEGTCWETPNQEPAIPQNANRVNEIIEIGAILYDVKGRSIISEYQEFVRPLVYSQLSDFCKNLTHIEQVDVDKALLFPDVFLKFLQFFSISGGQQDPVFSSWGRYDKFQIVSDCRLHGVPYPFAEDNHLNIKFPITKAVGSKRRGIRSALNKLGLNFDGTQHRALDDVKNMVRMMQVMTKDQYSACVRHIDEHINSGRDLSK